MAKIRTYIFCTDLHNNCHKFSKSKFENWSEDHYVKNSKTIYCDTLEVNEKFQSYINEIKGVNITNSKLLDEFSPGTVGIYHDDCGSHHAIIIENHRNNTSKMLFLTSKPYWNSKSRIVSKEERSLLGRPDWGYSNYFAPVIRLTNSFVTENFSFPMHRVISLKKEFWEI